MVVINKVRCRLCNGLFQLDELLTICPSPESVAGEHSFITEENLQIFANIVQSLGMTDVGNDS